MLVQSITNQYNPNFGIKFRLSEETIKSVEKSTGLTYEEMTTLSLKDSEKLMEKRGTLKKSGKLKLWVSDIYRKIGEKLGLLEKQYGFYTEY